MFPEVSNSSIRIFRLEHGRSYVYHDKQADFRMAFTTLLYHEIDFVHIGIVHLRFSIEFDLVKACVSHSQTLGAWPCKERRTRISPAYH